MEPLVIICVDDQREVLAGVARDLAILEPFVRIEECESAKEARTLLNELDVEGRPVALIVCDHIMPEVSGVEFLSSLVTDRRFPHVKKLLLTGQATHKDTIEAVNSARIDFYIEKPWEPDALASVCRRLISEFLFDAGQYSEEYRKFVDPQVLLKRLRESE
ncbi:MAG TPA: response regulator [Candidatus Avidesulfovibrio excrementigallinarum]|nr:response regulator [Candidatus Avidesulfovibrio excrementigallinarum]